MVRDLTSFPSKDISSGWDCQHETFFKTWNSPLASPARMLWLRELLERIRRKSVVGKFQPTCADLPSAGRHWIKFTVTLY